MKVSLLVVFFKLLGSTSVNQQLLLVKLQHYGVRGVPSSS